MKILYLITEGSYFLSHRLPLAREAMARGYEVALATRPGDAEETIRKEGIELIPIRLRRESRNPWREFLAVIELVRIYRTVRPDIVHHVAIKPVLYGSLAAWLAGVPGVVNAVAGMGSLFIAQSRKSRFMQALVALTYRWLFNVTDARIIVQNPDDRNLLLERNIARSDRIVLIRGAGVDLQEFSPRPELDGPPLVVLPARMLRDKGVGEFVEAARLIKANGKHARFALVGDVDPANPSSISRQQLQQWQEDGIVEWWGRRDDMPQVLALSHVVCLPSYREGLPKALLEAAACGRPIVATDVPGCREVVRHGVNGLLVLSRNTSALAEALGALLADPAKRTAFGHAGRQIAEDEFSLEMVTRSTMQLYADLVQTI